MSASLERKEHSIDPEVETEILKVRAALALLLKASEKSKKSPLHEISDMVRQADSLVMLLRLRPVEKVSGKPTFIRAINDSKEKIGHPLRFEIVKLLANASDKNYVMTIQEIADELETAPGIIKSHIPYLRHELKGLGLELAKHDDVAQLDRRGWKERFAGYRLTWEVAAVEVPPEVIDRSAPPGKKKARAIKNNGTPGKQAVEQKPQANLDDPNAVWIRSDAGTGYTRIPKRPTSAF